MALKLREAEVEFSGHKMATTWSLRPGVKASGWHGRWGGQWKPRQFGGTGCAFSCVNPLNVGEARGAWERAAQTQTYEGKWNSFENQERKGICWSEGQGHLGWTWAPGDPPLSPVGHELRVVSGEWAASEGKWWSSLFLGNGLRPSGMHYGSLNYHNARNSLSTCFF